MPLTDKVIAITGKLKLGTRNEIADIIQVNGGILAADITKNVTHLISSDPNAKSAKFDKAKKMGIVIVGEEFLSELKGKVNEQATSNVKKSKANAKAPSSSTQPPAKKQKIGNDDFMSKAFDGMYIAITGKLTLSRAESKKIIESNGGQFCESITKAVTHLICADPQEKRLVLVLTSKIKWNVTLLL